MSLSMSTVRVLTTTQPQFLQTSLLPSSASIQLNSTINNIKHFMSQDSLILSIKGDRAFALNAASAHIFEDQSQGRRFRSILNNHMETKF